MSLTSYWRAGKLEDGDYYIKTSGVIIPAYFDGLYFEGADYEDIQKVLAPIPSYDHFVDLTEKAKKYDRIKVNGNYPDKISKLKSRIKHLLDLQDNQDKEVERLRELLRECLAHLSLGEIGISITPLNILLEHIKAAIGESEVNSKEFMR